MLLGYLTDTSISCKLRHMMFENERKEIGVDSRGGGGQAKTCFKNLSPGVMS